MPKKYLGSYLIFMSGKFVFVLLFYLVNRFMIYIKKMLWIYIIFCSIILAQ